MGGILMFVYFQVQQRKCMFLSSNSKNARPPPLPCNLYSLEDWYVKPSIGFNSVWRNAFTFHCDKFMGKSPCHFGSPFSYYIVSAYRSYVFILQLAYICLIVNFHVFNRIQCILSFTGYQSNNKYCHLLKTSLYFILYSILFAFHIGS